MIGGNTNLIIKLHSSDGNYPWNPLDLENAEIDETKDAFDENGSRIKTYTKIASLFGWLDLITGDSKYDYKTKIEDSTHVFICDYIDIKEIDTEEAKAEINGEEYDIRYIDDPMELHEQLEIYLKKVGGQ